MPGYMWELLAMMFETFCVYAILFAVYTCPPEMVEEKKCIWVKPTDIRSLLAKTAEKLRTDAEKFLKSVNALFGFDGEFTAVATAAVVVRPGAKGFDT